VKQRSRNWLYLGLTAALLAGGSALVFLLVPRERGALWLALYTIPSHMFVSPLPHEPVLLYFSKQYSATICALASTMGCLVAGMWDYWLFIPLMHHSRVRSKYANAGLYQRSVRLFRKSPFWALVFAGLTPLPFYPVKFLSIGDRYPLRKYLLALLVGRAPRYWLIAYLGYVFRFPNWSLIVLALAFLAFTLIQSRREAKRKKSADADFPGDAPVESLNSSQGRAKSRRSGT